MIKAAPSKTERSSETKENSNPSGKRQIIHLGRNPGATIEIGFSLMEMLVTIALISIISAFAVPMLPDLNSTFNRMNARSYLHQDLKRAQAEAITQGCRGVFSVINAGASYVYGCDYLPYDTSTLPSPDVVSFTRNLPDDITMSTSTPPLFNSRGQSVEIGGAITNTTITLNEHEGSTINSYAEGLLNGNGVFTYSY